MASDGAQPLIVSVVEKYGSVSEDVVKVLLAEPSLDLTIADKRGRRSWERVGSQPTIAAMIRAEVRRVNVDQRVGHFLDAVLRLWLFPGDTTSDLGMNVLVYE